MIDYAGGVSKNPAMRQSGQGAEDIQEARILSSDTGDAPEAQAEVDSPEVANQESPGAQTAHGKGNGACVPYTLAQMEGGGSLGKGHGFEEEAGQSRNSATKQTRHWIRIESRSQHSTDCGLPACPSACHQPPSLQGSPLPLAQNSCR